MSCIVYKFEDLEELVNKEQDIHQEIYNFYNEFTFEKVLNLEKMKDNSQFIFANEINKNETRSTIIQLLNRLNKSNLQKTLSLIRDIEITSPDEIDDLIKQCMIKIKQETNVMKPLVGKLCKDLLPVHFVDVNGNKIYFRQILLTSAFNEYKFAMNFISPEWDEEKAKKSIILIGTLMNASVIEKEITEKIVEDFKKKIVFIDKSNNEDIEKYYGEVEKSMQLLSLLMSTIVEKENKEVFMNAKHFIERELDKYENIKCISRKTRIFFKDALDNLENDEKN